MNNINIITDNIEESDFLLTNVNNELLIQKKNKKFKNLERLIDKISSNQVKNRKTASNIR